MGFGFNLFFVLVLLPLTAILALIWLVSRKAFIGKLLAFVWLGLLGLSALFAALHWITSKTILDKEDYYGEYVINREYFPGEQSDWQYNHLRFEITTEDSIFFYVTDEEEILKTFKGTIRTTSHSSQRLIIQTTKPTHHILTSNPTTYRSSWNFYLVFNSPKFHNVFFKKGKWKPIK